MKKLIYGFLFVLLMISFASAVPPTATTEGWIIRSAVPDVFQKIDGSYDFHAHVFDATTGNPVIEDAGCYIHIYDTDGTHLYEGYDDTASHDFDYSFMVNDNNFSVGFEYPYIMQCNGTYATDDEGGYYASSFIVTDDGHAKPEGIVIVFFSLYALMSFLFMLYSLYIILGALTSVSTTWETVFLGLAGYFNTMAVYYFLSLFLSLPLLLDLALWGLGVFGFTHMFVPLIGIIFSWIKNGRVD